MTTSIILLHGLGAHPITLEPLRLYLNYKGYDDIYNIKYNVDKYDTVEQSVKEVDDILLDYGLVKSSFADDKQASELVLIGQSMGGVVANNLHAIGWNIKFAIYIGSPLHGAKLLGQLENILPTTIVNKLHKPPYDLLKDKPPEKEPPHPYKTITMSWLFFSRSGFDGCVYKEESILNEEHNTHLSGADHRTIFANPRLWMLVHKLIQQMDKEV